MFDPRRFNNSYPFTGRRLDLGGIEMHYLDEGDGPPVLMLHGNPTWSFYYRGLVAALRGDFRCIVPDHVGCGLSDKPSDRRYRYTLQSRVRDVETLLDHLAIAEPLTLVLHDWGGMIGMAVAARRPERIARLVIFNTAGFRLPAGKQLPLRLRLIRNHRWFAGVAVRGFNAFAFAATRMATARGLSAEACAGLPAPYDSWANRIATLRFVQDIPLAPGDPSYALVREVDEALHQFADRPALVCWGMKDFVFDGDYLAEWRRRLPNAEVHEFPDAGHYVLEDAGEQIEPLVRAFLTGSVGAEGNVERSKSRKVEAPVRSVADSAFRIPHSEFLNVSAHLHAAAGAQPDHRAIVWTVRRGPDGPGESVHLTFRELDREADRYAHGLILAGIRRGTRTILMVPPGPSFFALTFALYRVGAVPVLIDPGMGRERMAECLRGVEAEAFIGVPPAQVFRLLHRRAFRSIRVTVTVGRRWAWGGWAGGDLRTDPWRPFTPAATRPDDPAAIIFTTGSTGPPKGVLFQHGVFDAQLRALRDHFGVRPGEIDLATFPLFALFDPALGMTAVIPEMDFTRPAMVDPRKIIGAIHEHQVTHMFGSPALLDRVARYGAANGVRLPSLRRVISAGAAVPPALLERFAGMLPPEARIHTPYGATEALPVASADHEEILGQTRAATEDGGGICVGRPVGDAEVRIIRICNEPIDEWSKAEVLPPGEVGEIAVKGPAVTQGYVADEGANRLHKIRDAAGRPSDSICASGAWHRMGDTGYLDERGRLWFCGRKAHRVVTRHGTLFTEPCEAIFNRHPCVRRSALVGIGSPPRQRPVICIELDGEAGSPTDSHDSLTAELLRLARANERTRSIETVLYHPAFPVDIRHNAKIFREKLAVWAAEQLK